MQANKVKLQTLSCEKNMDAIFARVRHATYVITLHAIGIARNVFFFIGCDQS